MANPLIYWPIHHLAGQSIIFEANPWIGQPISVHPENEDWPGISIGRPIQILGQSTFSGCKNIC